LGAVRGGCAQARIKLERDESAAKLEESMEEVANPKKEKAAAQTKLKSQGEKNQDLANRRREAEVLAKASKENERQARLRAEAAESKAAEQEERAKFGGPLGEPTEPLVNQRPKSIREGEF
jgi:hypothetical protein